MLSEDKVGRGGRVEKRGPFYISFRNKRLMEICQPRDLWCAADGEQMYFEHPPGIEVEATQSVVRAF